MNEEIFIVEPFIRKASEEAIKNCKQAFDRIEKVTEYCEHKMMRAFMEAKVSESHFAATTGYGYGDRGRVALDRVYSRAFGAEDAIVSHQFVSGTHALTVALFGVLRPGDKMVCVTGAPYDTLHSVIGQRDERTGSLSEFGIQYDQVELTEDGHFRELEIERHLMDPCVRMIYIQRSRGYSLRPSISVSDIRDLSSFIKKRRADCIVMVDNCYGEFVEEKEPTDCGADLMAGSLIKNPGGGIAPTGGYIAGKRQLVKACSYRLTTPGTGREIGASLGQNRELFMGAFHAPHVTGEAVKTAVFAAAFFERLGFRVTPRATEPRTDIIQTIEIGSKDGLIAFCKGIQRGSPVDAFVTPEPWNMPGYDHQVIMAAGAFTMGASIELSADAPIRPPFAVWMQGGLHFHSGKLGILLAAQSLFDGGVLKQ